MPGNEVLFSFSLITSLTPLSAPLNLANSPSLHLLTPAEQTLCSQLRILPKPYLVVKETLVREYARRGGKLRRREARDLVKIDVNKTSRVWDFLAQAGFLQINAEPSMSMPAPPPPNSAVSLSATPSQDSRYVANGSSSSRRLNYAVLDWELHYHRRYHFQTVQVLHPR